MNISALTEEFSAGKVLLFNKPLYWTSFDLVNKVKYVIRHHLQLKKLKIGHAGTLDPLATGLMVLCTGKETRNIEKYQEQPKEYVARIRLGATTPSFDLETDIDADYPVDHIGKQDVEEALKDFTGVQLQAPPYYSARLVNGTRAYKLARKGEQPELPPKEITIYSISLTDCNLPNIEICVLCSKGTYVRSLARDIGIKLRSGAHLTGLVRTGIGNFSLQNALSIEDFERNLVFL
ncbi:MAG: tRNA pseudouridine(55) synthase TruB [Bacteroidales bacterium]|nr:tRNA pseudouridine(55) synthase TruB [Bacteroidales bacterium]